MNRWKNREMKTARVMIEMFCRRFHRSGPCRDCADLLQYVEKKIEKCPYAAEKPACSDCPTHCYPYSSLSSTEQPVDPDRRLQKIATDKKEPWG